MDCFTDQEDIPEFLKRATAGVTLISVIILLPFSIVNFYFHRIGLGILIFLIVILCLYNGYQCRKGDYNIYVNMYGVVPLIILSINFAIFKLGIIGSFWAYLGLLSCFFILPEKQSLLAAILFLLFTIPVAMMSMEKFIYIRFIAVLLSVAVYAYITIKEIYRQHRKLNNLAITDQLTGLYNRTMLDTLLNKTACQLERIDLSVSLMMLDIDHFKKINDSFGHDVGDIVLKKFSSLLLDFFRKSDTVFRMGGEEFLVLLIDPSGRAEDIAERLRKKIEETFFIPNYQVTASISVVNLVKGDIIEKKLKICDEKLYKAKNSGRNKVMI
jgi:diguanylate cyclase (GGDEF)-like protein